jgi:hypothetical protein
MQSDSPVSYRHTTTVICVSGEGDREGQSPGLEMLGNKIGQTEGSGTE